LGLIGALLSIFVTPIKAAATTCYVVINGVLTDGTGCSGALVIDSSVTSIGQTIGGGRDQYGAFEDVQGITSVIIPATVTSIGYAAFRGSNNLTSVTFASGSTLASIDRFAFSGMQNLRQFTIPSSVTSISSVAFSQSQIREFIFEGAAPGLVVYNGPGFQDVNYQAVGFVTAAHEASFKSPNPLILNNIAVSGVSPPTIYSPLVNDTMYGQVGYAFNTYDLSFSEAGTATASVSSGALPPGLSLNPNGQLRGTPTTAGTYTVAFTVTAGGSRSRTVTGISLVIAGPDQPYINYPEANSTITRRVGNPINIEMDFYPNQGVITKSAGNLPTGVTLNSSGVFSGSPTVAGTYTFSLTITDPYSQSVTNQNISILVLPAFTGNITISASRMVIAAPNNGSPTQYSLIQTTAPSDFKLGSFLRDEGCTDGEFILYSFDTVAASEYTDPGLSSDYNCSGFATYVFRIYDLTATTPNFNSPYLATVTVQIVTGSTEIPIIAYPTSNSTFNGQVGTAFNLTMIYNSGVAPEATTVTSGALPPGITLSAAGRISGTPTTAGTYTAAISLTDSTSARSTVSGIRFVIAAGNDVPPQAPPVPFLTTLTQPQLRLEGGKLQCLAGTYSIGNTINGVVDSQSIRAYSPTSFTFNLLSNGITQSALSVTTTSASNSWNLAVATPGTVLTCAVSVRSNSLTNIDRSSDNSQGMSAAESTQKREIKAAEAVYAAAVKANTQVYQKALIQNRKVWRTEVNAIRANFEATLTRIKSDSGSRMISDVATALKVMVEAKSISSTNYAASKPASMAAKDAADKTALETKSLTVAKANTAFKTFIESKGYGVFIP